jgi:uncharacterized protein
MPVPRFFPKSIARHVLADYQLELAGIHGPAHWLRVRTNGLALARRTLGADTIVIEAFALLHDARLVDDFRDLGHGERAADFARALHQRGLLGLTDAAVDVLADACAGHENGQISDHPTIGCCWDADRLDLSRLERRPIEEYLSTRAARDARVQRAAWRQGKFWYIDARGVRAARLARVSLILIHRDALDSNREFAAASMALINSLVTIRCWVALPAS